MKAVSPRVLREIECVSLSGVVSVLARIADALVLQPTRDEIDAEHRQRQIVDSPVGAIEVWKQWTVGGETTLEPHESADLFVLKFPGTGGRAERAGAHPGDVWSDLTTEIWAVNPPGYGGSSGRASLQQMDKAAASVFVELSRVAGERPVIVTGNSLGCTTSLFLAANFPVDGLMLRNPPPLRQLIVGRYSWWNLSLGSRLIARQVPQQLCSVTNASATPSPILFVMSEQDTMVPPKYQQRIIEAHRGEQQVFRLPDADHATPITEEHHERYFEALGWLRGRMRLDG